MLTKSDDIIWRVVDDEALLLNTVNGYYFSMNGTATEAWCLLNEDKTVDEVAKILAERYDIDSEDVRRDVEELLAQLKDEKILEQVNE